MEKKGRAFLAEGTEAAEAQRQELGGPAWWTAGALTRLCGMLCEMTQPRGWSHQNTILLVFAVGAFPEGSEGLS